MSAPSKRAGENAEAAVLERASALEYVPDSDEEHYDAELVRDLEAGGIEIVGERPPPCWRGRRDKERVRCVRRRLPRPVLPPQTATRLPRRCWRLVSTGGVRADPGAPSDRDAARRERDRRRLHRLLVQRRRRPRGLLPAALAESHREGCSVRGGGAMMRQTSPHGFKAGAGKPTDRAGQRHDSRPEKALEKAQGRTNAPTDTVLGPSSAGSINVTPLASGATGDRAARLFSGTAHTATMPVTDTYQQAEPEGTR